MKRIYILIAAAAVSAVSSCKKDEMTAIDIRTEIQGEGITKSPVLDDQGKGSFSNGDTFTLLVSNGNGEISPFEYTVGSTGLYWKDIETAEGNGLYDFSACCPPAQTEKGIFTFDLNDTPDRDLLIARTSAVQSGTGSPVTLTFRHAMHRLKVTYTSDMDIDGISTVCNGISTCEVNLPAGTLTAGTATSDFEKTGKEAAFLLVPQKASGVTLTATVEGKEYTFVLSELKQDLENLEGGMQLTVAFRVKKDNITIDDITIEGWGNQGTIEGDIII